MSVSVPTTLSGVLEPLGDLAAQAMRDMYTERGKAFRRAVAGGRMQVVHQPGAYVEVNNAIVLGANLRGRARNGSYIVDVGNGGGLLETRDCVVVGNGVRVLSHGNTTVRGRGARVTAIKRRRGSGAAANKSMKWKWDSKVTTRPAAPAKSSIQPAVAAARVAPASRHRPAKKMSKKSQRR